VLSQVLDLTEVFSEAGSQAFVEHLHGEEAGEVPHPESLVLQPIFEDFGVDPKITGVLLVALPWNVFFDNLLNDEASVVCVVRNICGQNFTYRIEGQDSIFLGRGDRHDPEFDEYERSADFTGFDNVEFRVGADGDEHADEEHVDDEHVNDEHRYAEEIDHADHGDAEEIDHTEHGDAELDGDAEHSGVEESVLGHAMVGSCDYTLHIYPTQELKSLYESNKPLIYTAAVILVFTFTSLVFVMYDCLVEKRQKKVMTSAKQTGAIVASLFPKVVRDRMFAEGTTQDSPEELAMRSKLPTYDAYGSQKISKSKIEMNASRPIANLFPHTTVLFADIAGFT
jgi:hypothetical protein